MRKLHEIYRLHFEAGLSQRTIAGCVRASTTTVGEYLRRFERAGLSWPEAKAWAEADLEKRLFPSVCHRAPTRPMPDWALVQKEIKSHKGVTLKLLWEEYRQRHGDAAYSRSRFCELYREWSRKIDVTMRQDHRAGEMMFVDYAGVTVPITDPANGLVHEAQIFVAVLGASNYTYAEATRGQTLREWIDAHCRAFRFFGGCTELVVPDNAKVGVKSPSYYEPDLNRTYQSLAEHYGVAIAPARIRKAQDKASVEKAVQQVERDVLARLRHVKFFSLADLNAEIRRLVARHNEQPFQKLDGSRRSYYVEIDRPALKPLPATRFVFAEWKRQTLPSDYHVEVEGHYYSAPYRLRRLKLDVTYTDRTVEIFYKGQRVASHARSRVRGGKTTVLSHMPAHHRHWAERSPERYMEQARRLGEATGAFVAGLFERAKHPQLAYKSSEGVLRLAREYGTERLETACRRALRLRAFRYRHLESTLENGLEEMSLPEENPHAAVVEHANLRGAGYYR
jgi:transposase